MKRYNVIYADPSWKYNSKHYQDSNRDFMKLEDKYKKVSSFKEIAELPIKNMINKPALLFLWVTSSHLNKGIELMKYWNFKYKTVAFVWIKTYRTGNFCYNFGHWTLPSTELCLLGTHGTKFKKESNNIKQLVIAERLGHSVKPEEVRRRIDKLVGNKNKLELFARKKNDGWDVWGNEAADSIDMSEYTNNEKK